MMTFNRLDLADFFAARSRTDVTAEAALKDLESRDITGAATTSKNTARALCDSLVQKSGRKLNELTSHELAAILRG